MFIQLSIIIWCAQFAPRRLQPTKSARSSSRQHTTHPRTPTHKQACCCAATHTTNSSRGSHNTKLVVQLPGSHHQQHSGVSSSELSQQQRPASPSLPQRLLTPRPALAPPSAAAAAGRRCPLCRWDVQRTLLTVSSSTLGFLFLCLAAHVAAAAAAATRWHASQTHVLRLAHVLLSSALTHNTTQVRCCWETSQGQGLTSQQTTRSLTPSLSTPARLWRWVG